MYRIPELSTERHPKKQKIAPLTLGGDRICRVLIRGLETPDEWN